MISPEHQERYCQPALLPKEIPDWKECIKTYGDIFGSIKDMGEQFPADRFNRFSSLRYRLAELLKGQSLGEWVEGKTTILLAEFGYLHAPAVRLEEDEALLRELKINKIRFRVGLPERGSLSIQKDGFLITLDPTFFPPFGFRVVLAHEIAHTFFYDRESSPPRRLIFFGSENRELEWACWYIARNLLVPASLFRKKIALYPELESNEFSINVFFDLAEKFEVPWPLIAIRLAEDLPLESELYELDKE